MYRSYSLRHAQGAFEQVEESVEERLAGRLSHHHYVVALQLGRRLALLERFEIVDGALDLPGRRLAIEADVAPVRYVLDSPRGEDRLLGGGLPSQQERSGPLDRAPDVHGSGPRHVHDVAGPERDVQVLAPVGELGEIDRRHHLGGRLPTPRRPAPTGPTPAPPRGDRTDPRAPAHLHLPVGLP